MTRQDAIYYLISELSDYSFLWAEKAGTNEDVEASQQRDLEALLALGVTPEEIVEAQS